MRAIYLEVNFSVDQELVISGESAHHLMVVRLKSDEEVLIINGRGYGAVAIVLSFSKKEILFKVKNIVEKKQLHKLSIAIACPKKDAFEDIIKNCVELGIANIYPIKSSFSQFEYVQNERMNKIIESAMIQSNNFFLPTIHPMQTLANFITENSNQLIYFSSLEVEQKVNLNREQPVTILVGPEAGFSDLETQEILASNNVNQIHFPTPILRAPTAVATSVGYLIGILK